MPLYDYRCTSCGAVMEVRHGAGERFTGACTTCGGTALQRIFNPAPIHFKGSGFYATDSKKKSETPEKSKPEPKPGDSPRHPERSAEGAKSKDASPPKPSGESAA